MKFLFNYKIIVRLVTWFPVVFKILFHHLICYISCAPCSITDRPEVPTPISFLKCWKFFLKPTRTSAFQSLYKLTDRFGRWIFNMDVDMILAHHTFQYLHILRFTYLPNQISASLQYIALKNRISIFCNPNYVYGQPGNGMATVLWTLAHLPNLQKCVATKVLHLKCIVSTNDCDQ